MIIYTQLPVPKIILKNIYINRCNVNIHDSELMTCCCCYLELHSNHIHIYTNKLFFILKDLL